MTSSTSAGSTAGAFSSSACTMVAPRSSGRRSTSDPLFARPIGVRAVATMTASMFVLLVAAAEWYRWGRKPPPSISRMPDDVEASASDLPAERARRLADLDDLRARGVDPYPVRFDRDRTLGELRAEFGDLPPGTETETAVRVAGRILLLRRQGKLTFATIRDQSGTVQLFVSRAELGE